jgi:hypothetical protein
LEDKALDLTVWRARFGKGYRPVVRKKTELKNYILKFILLRFFLWLWRRKSVTKEGS